MKAGQQCLEIRFKRDISKRNRKTRVQVWMECSHRHCGCREALRLGRWLASVKNPAGVIYGVLAVGTLIAAESTRRETYESVIGASSLVIYWLAHAYAYHLGERLQRPEEWQPHNIGATLLHEAALVKGSALPIVALLGSWLAGAGLSTGVAVAR